MEVDCFSLWRAYWGALWKQYDIFHLHWPEYYLNRRLPKALIGSLMVLLSTAWLRWRGTRVLWTVHNPHSHALSHPALESWFWRRFTGMLDGYVSLSDSCAKWVAADVPGLRDAESAVIPHGHYRQAYPAPVGKVSARVALGLAPRQTVLLFFGAVSPYKNVPHLVTTFRNSSLPDGRMLIAGRAEPRTCALAGPNGPFSHRGLAKQAAADASQNVTYPGSFRLVNGEVADGCHANTAGQLSLGRQALAYWG